MPAEKNLSELSSNTFVKIVYNDDLTDEQKKDAVVVALTFDVLQPAQNQAMQAEFTAFKAHLKADRQNLAHGIMPESSAGVLSQAQGVFADFGAAMKKMSEGANGQGLTEEEKKAAVVNSLQGFLKSTKLHGNKVKEGFNKTSTAKPDPAELKEAKAKVAAIYKLVTAASAEATVLNEATAEALAAAINQYNVDMSKSLSPVLMNALKKTGTFLLDAVENPAEPAPAAPTMQDVATDVAKEVGSVVAKSAGKAVAKEVGRSMTANVGKTVTRKAKSVFTK